MRKHGKDIIGKQLASRRLADVMIDLFVLACVLSRVSRALDTTGSDAAARDVEIAQVFTEQVRGRVMRNFKKIDSNDDDAVKSLADHAYEREGYSWDIL